MNFEIILDKISIHTIKIYKTIKINCKKYTIKFLTKFMLAKDIYNESGVNISRLALFFIPFAILVDIFFIYPCWIIIKKGGK